MSKRKIPQRIWKAYERLRLRDGLCCRQYSACEEAMERGGGYIYFDGKNNERIPTASAKFLIENGLVEPVSDGLFEDTPQTFRAVPFDKFEDFKRQYEQV